MVFDYKKEYQEFYMPANKPSIVTVSEMKYIAVCGKGDPNDEKGIAVGFQFIFVNNL